VNVGKVLNVHVGENEFGLVWKQGATVVSEVKIPKNPIVLGEDKVARYPDLAAKIEEEWKQHGNGEAGVIYNGWLKILAPHATLSRGGAYAVTRNLPAR
jgi:hypothetical protein